ncbi:MAG: hypothetical protein ABIQ65_02050 [Thermoanaerobaculia bacterium]
MRRQLHTHAAQLFLALLFALTVPQRAAAQARAPGASGVMSFRQTKLKSGVNAAEFERYFADSIAGPIGRHVPGMRAYLLKGERGARIGQYVMVFEFNSLDRRNEYFPKPDAPSSRWTNVARALPARFLEDLTKYVEDAEYTDYVVAR